MRLSDLFRLAAANLQRNRTRSLLTLIGVAVGTAALLALLAYGAGLQRNAQAEFNALELYNTLRVTATPNPVNTLGDLAYQQQAAPDRAREAVPVTDSLLHALAQLDGVLAAYPEVVFPVEIRAGGRQTIATAEAIPQAFARLPSYQPAAGRFFETPTDTALLIAPSMARRLGYEPAEAAVGDTLTLVTATLDLRALQTATAALRLGLTALPIQRREHPMRVAGLLPEEQQAVSGFFRALLPLETARQMQKITFFSTLDLLMRRGPSEGYQAARVQLTDADAYQAVRDSIEARGVYVTSFREQFAQLDRLFLILDLALGVIGFIALLVATIGIANTMMMNVMERYQEIGIMKALGGDEGDLQRLFVLESAAIGLAGGAMGLVLGWSLTVLINLLVNLYLRDLGIAVISVFHISAWMVGAILALAVSVSLVAGVAPARKAARIEPLVALRST